MDHGCGLSEKWVGNRIQFVEIAQSSKIARELSDTGEDEERRENCRSSLARGGQGDMLYFKSSAVDDKEGKKLKFSCVQIRARALPWARGDLLD
jgi:hypothetical protein